jgi:quercetin dioxygenase-like cupin family protein
MNKTAPSFKPQKEDYRLTGSRMRFLMTGEQTDGAFCMFEVEKPAGGSTPPHIHLREEETMHMLEGEMTAVVDGTPYLLRAGDIIFLPRDLKHQIVDHSDRIARYILVCTPAGFDDFVLDAGEPWDESKRGAPPTLEEINRLLAAAPKHGITILQS